MDEQALRERVRDEPDDCCEVRFPPRGVEYTSPEARTWHMTKQELRERVWNALEDSGAARFPFPP